MSRFLIRTLIGPRGCSAYLHFYYKKIVAQTMAVVCATNVSMFLIMNMVQISVFFWSNMIIFFEIASKITLCRKINIF